MDLNSFKNDSEIIEYLQKEITKITPLNECRLFREEQLQISEEMLHFRNCIEWLIRSNVVICNTKYALEKSLEFSNIMIHPLEDTDNKRLYSYYLEDALYRVLVLWDMYKQLLNEYYKCGLSEKEDISIFQFLKQNKVTIGESTVNNLLAYLNSPAHKTVRNDLRNSFTHSIEATSSYIFHRNINGKVKPQMDYFFPKHPFENINYIVLDVVKLLEFMQQISDKMYEYRNDKLALFNVTLIMPCGVEHNDSEYWSKEILFEKFERILVPCDEECDKLNSYNDMSVCKPKEVLYKRVNSKSPGETLVPKMTFEEMKNKFD